jgi:uncharacterized protein YjbJ (UPF0337 family)
MADMNDKTKPTFEAAAGKAKGLAGQAADGARAAAGAAGSMAGNALDAVKEKVHDVTAGASELAGKTRDTVQDWASSVSGAAVQAKDKAQEVATDTLDKVGDLGQDITDLIRRYPIPALLLAFGVGFLGARALQRS